MDEQNETTAYIIHYMDEHNETTASIYIIWMNITKQQLQYTLYGRT